MRQHVVADAGLSSSAFSCGYAVRTRDVYTDHSLFFLMPYSLWQQLNIST